MKLPAIQFYPGDWHKDQGVQSLDLEHRGAWLELLLMMHDSDERGVLVVNGLPMSNEVIARRLGLDNQKSNQILSTLLTYGVASRREEDGAIYSRRMVKDENLRKIRVEAGKKGGNPNLVNQNPKQKTTTGVKQNPTPSITSSTTYNIPPNPQGGGECPFKLSFDQFRQKYPGTKRGLDTEFEHFKKKAGKEWKEILPTLPEKLQSQKNGRAALKEAGKFTPEWKHLKTWINNRGWEEEIEPAYASRAIPRQRDYEPGFDSRTLFGILKETA